MIAQVLVNHRSVSLACCNAVIPEFVEAIKRIAARLTRRKSRTSPETAPNPADHAIRRRFRAIRRFSIADIQHPNDLSDNKISERKPNHHHEKSQRSLQQGQSWGGAIFIL
jgi:hypothetical protein